jgi:hypothetical protein
MVSIRKIILILDGKALTSEITRSFAGNWNTEAGEAEQTRSLVVADGRIYASPISALTLKKRLQRINAVFGGHDGWKKDKGSRDKE